MTLNTEELKRKILYRSSYRGTKEMDILLLSFVKSIFDKLSKDELNDLLNLVNIDDDNLYKFKNGLKTDIEIDKNYISKLFRNYILK
tara:strand:- start:896 stop:1156 length:261 start_codon:yes stop_codon:yes gene_type:complete